MGGEGLGVDVEHAGGDLPVGGGVIDFAVRVSGIGSLGRRGLRRGRVAAFLLDRCGGGWKVAGGVLVEPGLGVGELAVALSSVLRHEGGEPAATVPALRAFHQFRPLNASEVAAVWPLVVLRAATLVVSGNQQAAIDSLLDALDHR